MEQDSNSLNTAQSAHGTPVRRVLYLAFGDLRLSPKLIQLVQIVRAARSGIAQLPAEPPLSGAAPPVVVGGIPPSREIGPVDGG